MQAWIIVVILLLLWAATLVRGEDEARRAGAAASAASDAGAPPAIVAAAGAAAAAQPPAALPPMFGHAVPPPAAAPMPSYAPVIAGVGSLGNFMFTRGKYAVGAMLEPRQYPKGDPAAVATVCNATPGCRGYNYEQGGTGAWLLGSVEPGKWIDWPWGMSATSPWGAYLK